VEEVMYHEHTGIFGSLSQLRIVC